jgi:hypothetical protein
MGRLPRRARAYLLFILSCAALLLLATNPAQSPLGRDDLLLCLVMAVGLVLADTHMIELSHTTKLSVSTALEFALLLMVGPALAVWTIAVSVVATAPHHLRRAWKWYNVAFYAANGVISVSAAGELHSRLSAGAPLLSSPQSALALLAAAITYYLLNVGIVAGMVAMARNSDSLANFISAFRAAAPQFAGLLALGTIAATVYSHSPLAAALLAIPLLGVYSSLRSTLNLRAETKQALEKLAAEVDQYHPYTAQHSERVAIYSARIAHKLQLSEEQQVNIQRAARIHDLGKLGIWKEMLNKPSKLTPEEVKELQTHPARGAELVSRFPDYRNGKDLILHHHERYDGHGYPDGLKGDEIPLGARIIAVADSADAMMSDRPYRKALTAAETIEELSRNSGKQFDPMVVNAMLEILEGDRGLIVEGALSAAPMTS